MVRITTTCVFPSLAREGTYCLIWRSKWNVIVLRKFEQFCGHLFTVYKNNRTKKRPKSLVFCKFNEVTNISQHTNWNSMIGHFSRSICIYGTTFNILIVRNEEDTRQLSFVVQRGKYVFNFFSVPLHIQN